MWKVMPYLTMDLASIAIDHAVLVLTNPDDQISCMNKLFRECIEQHTPLRKIEVTRPPARRLNDEIHHLQKCRNKLHKEAHSTGSEKAWQLFPDARNKLKTLIRHAKDHRISLVKSGKLFTE